MFANTFQTGFVSIFYSVGSNPLQLWDKQVKNGHIRRVVDDEVRSLVLEISGTNVATTYITCPIKPRLSLGIKLPFLVMIIKNLKKYFTFEIQILDDKDMHRRFRVSNFQSTTKVRPFCTTMPIGLSSGWNQVQFNLADFTKRAYGSTYLETTRVQIHANVRIRRIYFCDMLYSDEELPNEYKLFVPTPGQPTRPSKAEKKESIAKEEEKRPSQVGAPEERPPEGAEAAPPSPEFLESPTVEPPPSSPEPQSEGEPPSESILETSEVVEPPSETQEEMPTDEMMTPTTETTEVEAAGDVFVDAEGGEVVEGGVPQEGAPEGEAQLETPYEAAPVEAEQAVMEEAPVEAAPVEEVPEEATPAEVVEEVPVEEAPAEEPAPEAEAAAEEN